MLFFLSIVAAGVYVDREHDHYQQAEASLEFLQEKLRSVEAAGAGDTEEYDRSTAELHEQLDTQASRSGQRTP
jgi:hypothetical protein